MNSAHCTASSSHHIVRELIRVFRALLQHLRNAEELRVHQQVRRRHRAIDPQHPLHELVHSRHERDLQRHCADAARVLGHRAIRGPGEHAWNLGVYVLVNYVPMQRGVYLYFYVSVFVRVIRILLAGRRQAQGLLRSVP